MSHFAKVQDGVVVQVIVAEQSVIDSGLFGPPSEWVQTSYNTHAGVHWLPEQRMVTPSGQPSLRANFAGIGHIYDSENDVFYHPKPLDRNGLPCDSWTIGEPDWLWKPPIPAPPPIVVDVNNPKNYSYNAWDEPTQTWVVISPNQ